MAQLLCNIVDCGTFSAWMPFAKQDGHKVEKLPLEDQENAVFMVDNAGTKIELRKLPPFIQILPCPFCGVEKDHDHKPLEHIDSRLGTPVEKER